MNERILIIDDEPSIHEVVRAYLERDGFIVYGATDGHAGLDMPLTKRPQLVALDLMLPDISGEEICRQLRERSDVAILRLTREVDRGSTRCGSAARSRRLPDQAVQPP
jgi:DNA-binding response OmpR family regulator